MTAHPPLRTLIDLVAQANAGTLTEAAVHNLTMPEYLYHGTTTRYLPDILAAGLVGRDGWGGSYWGTREVAQFFAKHKAKEKGGRQIIITVPISKFDPSLFKPDFNLMDFPIPLHDPDFEQRHEGIADPQNPTWQESLRYFDAVVYAGTMKITPDQCSDTRGRPVGNLP